MIDMSIEPPSVTAAVSRIVTVRLGSGPEAGLRTNVVVGLDVPPGLGLEQGRGAFDVARLAPGQVHEHMLRIRPSSPGRFRVEVRNLSYRDEHGRSCRERGRSVELVVEPAAEVPTAAPEEPQVRDRVRPRRSIFVSYRRSDAKMMVPALVRDLGREKLLRRVDMFLDLNDVRAGARWRAVLDRELRQCTLLLAVIGPDWLRSTADRRAHDQADLVRHEIATALRRGIPVLPVLVEASMPREADLAPDIRPLAGRQGFVFDLPRYARSIEELATEIGFHLR
jgi:hypothetical protein